MKIIWIFMSFMAASLYAGPINDGNKLFAAEKYEEALEEYLKAREAEPSNFWVMYNLGDAYYRLGNYEKAKEEFAFALRSPDSSLASKAAYNLANTHFRIGEANSEPSARIASYREAAAYYKKAIDLNTAYENAKKNVEIVLRKLKEEIDKQKENQDNNQNENQEQPELSERAKEMLARALQMSKEGKYAPAKELLERVIAEDETAGSLNAYVQRIDDIIEIQAGRKPKTRIDASNADNELEVI
ncbi:MAG: tetratricopeptide repeat protein [Fibrobacter sp.]|jgi:tetratricopeptide (TPR) repeat protein|nr:tetratricopeptide repeat protein [Fibrobacter sp.]